MPLDLTLEGDSESKGEIRIDFFEQVRANLSLGDLVLFDKYSKTLGRRESSQSFIFYSDGKFKEEYGAGALGIQKGKECRAYASFDTQHPERYRLVNFWGDRLSNHRISPPSSWTSEAVGCNDFSNAPPARWKEFHSGGTRQIRIAKNPEDLGSEYEEVVRAVNFARDAVHFQLPTFYSMQNYLITEIGDSPGQKFDEKDAQRTNVTHRIAGVRATMNLLQMQMNRETNRMNQEWREGGMKGVSERYSDSLVAHQFGWYSKRVRGNFIERHNLPVNDEDYILQESMYPSRLIALAKVGRGVSYGEIYVLPFSEKHRQLVRDALSDEHIQEAFPMGFEPRRS